MTAKNTAEGFQFLTEELKANKDAVYADLKAKADKKGLTIYPVMFGRAKAMLGLVKSGKPGPRRAAGKKRGPGRPTSAGSKSARIRELLASGMGAADIAKQVGSSVNLVYSVKRRGGPGRARANGRASDVTDALEGVVASLREREQERERLRRTLEQIQTLIAGVL